MLADYLGCMIGFSVLLFIGAVVLIIVLVVKKRAQTPESPASALLPMPTSKGWFADPEHRHELRYWDGQRWTAAVSDRGVESQDPIEQ